MQLNGTGTVTIYVTKNELICSLKRKWDDYHSYMLYKNNILFIVLLMIIVDCDEDTCKMHVASSLYIDQCVHSRQRNFKVVCSYVNWLLVI